MKGIYKVALAFAAAVLVVGMGAAAAVSALRELAAASAAREQTASIVIRASELLASHALAADRVEGQATALRALVAGRPSQADLDEMLRLIDARSPVGEIRAAAATFVQAEVKTLDHQRAGFDTWMRRTFLVILIICGLALLFPLSFSYQVHKAAGGRLKDLVHAETRRLLEVQEDVNRQLQQANLTLHVSEAKLAVTLNSIDDAVIATDALARVTFLNPLAERLTGWTRAEAAGKPVDTVFRILNSDTREPIDLPVKETLALGTTLSRAEHTLAVARDGGECDIADSCAPIRDSHGHVVGAVLVFRDVTERKRMDLALREKNTQLEAATAVAEKANHAKSDFLSSMSHELRTPLNAILGFTQLMETGAPAPTPWQKRNLAQILKAGWYLLELINQILDLAVIESGKVSLSREPVPLLDVMLECRSMIEPEAQKRGIGMTFPSFDTPLLVNADRTRVKQVLINLLFNAIKYNTAGGMVTVQCAARSAETIRISVRDTGEGLAPEQLALLFQPFNRLGKDTGGEEGTGIGLVVTKRLVEMMGGSIGVESAVGTGSVFWIDLASAHAQQLSSAPEEISVPARVRTAADGLVRTVLYVEDNPANLELVEQLLARRPDLKLLGAADASTGIALARLSQPHAILMDINLPGLSGVEAMKILRLDAATMHIPIVALSANAMPRDVEQALAAGFFDYITKPIKVVEFMATLDAALKFSRLPAASPAPDKEAA